MNKVEFDHVFLQKGQKTDVISVLVKLEFCDRIIGESAKVDCSADQETPVNYSVSLPIATEDAIIIDELASKPLLCMYAVSSTLFNLSLGAITSNSQLVFWLCSLLFNMRYKFLS